MLRKLIIWGLGVGLIAGSLVPTYAYRVKTGEVLEYRLTVKSVIHGGNQTIRVTGAENFKNRPALTVTSTLTSVGLVKKITGYSETEELILDAEGLYPLRLKREIHDNKKVEVEEVSFDYARKVAIRILNKTNEPTERSEVKLPGYVQDGLSLQFFLRKSELKPGNYKVYFYSNGSVEEISYGIREVNQRLKMDCGQYSGYWVVDNPKVGITIVLSNDEDRLPLIIRKTNNIGKFESKLIKAL
jgi:hypothetical protein